MIGIKHILMSTNTDINLPFIRNKIYQLQHAIMYNGSQELMKVPDNIMKVLKVDSRGQLWFITYQPSECKKPYELNFPARLIFYRKGLPFFMELSGKTTLMRGAFRNRGEKFILFKMNVNQAVYTEP